MTQYILPPSDGPLQIVRRARPTLFAVAAGNLGGDAYEVRAVLTFVLRWDLMMLRARGAPSVANFADFWGQSERTVRRQLARYSVAFPGERDPTRLLTMYRPDDLSRGWRGFAEIAVDATDAKQTSGRHRGAERGHPGR